MPAPKSATRSFPAPTARTAARLAVFTFAVLALSVVYTDGALAQDPTIARVPAAKVTAQRTFVEASVFAAPGLECSVYPAGGDAATGASVHTDSDGYARFYSLRATSEDKVRALTMDCVDASGKPSTYPVDLTADDTFVSRPLDLEREPGIDRPALTGDPLSWSQEELLRAGYGLRPDPVSSPEAYGRWLAAATLPGRMLLTSHPHAHISASSALTEPETTAVRPETGPKQSVYTSQGPYWTGTVITGKPNYISVEGNISVPGVIPNGDETTPKQDVHVAVWNGLGGAGTGSGLIQGGYQIDMKNSVLNYTTFREYCCGNSKSNSYSGDFNPRSNDTVYSEEWYCDKKGNLNLNGGYGCTHLHDLNTGAILDCSSATESPCPSVPALPLCSVNPKAAGCETIGLASEAVIELQGPAWPDLNSTLTITGSSYSDKTRAYTQTVNNDPVLTYDTDFTGITFGPPTGKIPESPSHMNISIGSATQTYFNVSQFEKVGGLSHSGALDQVIAVGPNGNGSTLGDAWVLGSNPNSNGDYSIYEWVNGGWNKMPGAGTEIAIGPAGYPWVVNHAGVAFYWNGSGWEPISGTYCASHIAVGPNSNGSRYGTPWTLGCHEGTNGYNIYKLEGSNWVQQTGTASAIAIGPYGPWIVQPSGNVYYWDANKYVEAPGKPCASAIAAAPIQSQLANLSNDDVWILGCHEQSTGYEIYQYQGVNMWVPIPGYATQISISPDYGIPWIVDKNGNIYE